MCLVRAAGTLPFRSKAAAQLASVNFDQNSTFYTVIFILNGFNYNNYRLNTFRLAAFSGPWLLGAAWPPAVPWAEQRPTP